MSRRLCWANFSLQKESFLVLSNSKKNLPWDLLKQNVVGKCVFQVFGRFFWWQSFFDTKLTLGGSVVISLQFVWSFFKTSPAGSSNRLLGVQKNSSRIGFLETFMVSYQFSDLSKKLLEFRPKNWALLSSLPYKSLEEHFDDNFFFQESNSFFSEFDQKIFWLSTVLLKLHFALPDEEFMEWNVFLEEYKFSNVLRFRSISVPKVL